MNTTKRLPLAGVLAALVLALSIPATTLAGTRRIALGVSMSNSSDLTVLDNFTNSMGGIKPAIWALWSDWGGPDRDFPTATVAGLHSHGIVPMINWEPVDPSPSGQSDCANWSLAATIRGDHDAYIRNWALAAKASTGRVIVRYAHEMNGYWYIWGDGVCTNTPKKFKKAWKHVVNIFREVGATNVQFLWSVFGPYHDNYFYPGDAYVDYMGLTAFNWAQPGHPSWRSMVKTFAPTMKSLIALSRKPIIAAEMGAGYKPDCTACDKVAYIANGYPAVYAKWPQIAAMVYFNIDMRSQGQPDWRLDNPAGALDAYRTVVADATRFTDTLP